MVIILTKRLRIPSLYNPVKLTDKNLQYGGANKVKGN